MLRDGKALSATGEQRALADLTAAASRMCRQFAVRGESVGQVLTYVDGLRDLDIDLAIRTLDRYSKGVVAGHNNAFPPTVPQVREEATRWDTQFTTPKPADLRLPAPTPAPRTQAELDRVQALADSFRNGRTPTTDEIAKPVNDWLADYHAKRAKEPAP